MKHPVFILILFIFSLTGCQQSIPDTPEVKAGKLDLSQWDFEKSTALSLDGQWEFYWKELLRPNDFLSPELLPKNHFIQIPASWTNQKIDNGKICSAYGYATYHLKILLPEKHPRLGLFIPKVWSAVKVWVNDKKIYESGNVSTAYAGYENRILEKLVELDNPGKEIDLVVQVANFDMFIAGLIQSFRIGSYTKLMESNSLMYTWTLMWLGALLVMGLYHFILFLFRKERKSTLYFGIICILLGIRLIIFGEHYLYEYLKEHTQLLSYAVQSRVYYITTFSLIPLALIYVKSLYKDKIPKIAITASICITSVYCLFLLLAPPRLFILTVIYYQAAVAIFVLILLVALIRAAWQKMEDSVFQMAGIFVMVLAGVNDGLHAQGIEIFGAFELLPAAFAIFLSLQFVVLAKRFSRAFKQAEDLSLNLEKKVIQRTAELTQKNEEIEVKNEKLETAYKQIRDSVVYASRIQQAILGNQENICGNFKDAFIYFSPRDIVSGDFYWYAEVNPVADRSNAKISHSEKGIISGNIEAPHEFNSNKKLKIFAAVDCTGHGVPGAFMTVMGNDFLHETVIEARITDPQQILHELDKKIIQTLQKQTSDKQPDDGMDMALIVVDEEKKTLSFSGARNPLYLVRQKEIYEIKG